MRALIVYESLWGNTRTVAEAVAGGLADTCAVELGPVADAPPPDAIDVDLLVVGCPTHAFGLSRPATREEARARGASEVPDLGVREWLDGATSVQTRVATFDTHVWRPNLPGWASRNAAKVLRRLGATQVGRPESFYVHGYEGPLLDGELVRARTWGTDLAARLEMSARR